MNGDNITNAPAVRQLIHWAVDDGKPAGICIDEPEADFVPWEKLKWEVETRLLPQAVRVVPVGSTVETDEFHGRKDFLVSIINPDGNTIGAVWFGKDPERDWAYDGLVRLGNASNDHKAVVWQIYQRYSDGTYRLIRALDPSVEN